MSTHKIDIVEIGDILPHPDSAVQRMQITHVLGWQCCIGKGQFNKGDRAIYVEPDFEVPLSHPSFSFLRNKDNEGKIFERIRVRRFRGALSQGLLIAVPPELQELPVGTNVIEQLGIRRYEPPISIGTEGLFVKPPLHLYAPDFDVESYQNYRNLFVDGEEVCATEKLHGTSSRYVYAKDEEGNWTQFCGTRIRWIADDDRNAYWLSFRQNPGIGAWCKDHPDKILYGEIYGKVQALRYGADRNQLFFAAFGILDKQTWIDYDECQKLIAKYAIKWAPLAYRGPFNEARLLEIAEMDSLVPGANHLAEGIVIVPIHERTDANLGRVALKMVSNRYLLS